MTVKDFLFIGEFCEVFGPRPVFTIPTLLVHSKSNEKFNLDEFLLYIMTTDYQSFHGDKWDEASDVTCIRSNIIPQFHAILHYFTLRDPQARGGVRPSCIAYVTQNQTKLYHLKEEIHQVVHMSAQIIKHANMRWMRSLGQHVNCKENATVAQILDKWSHLSQSVPASEEKKLELWTGLCPKVMPIVIFAMLKLHQVCSRSLEDQVLDPKQLCITYDLFKEVNPEDAAVQSILSALPSFAIK